MYYCYETRNGFKHEGSPAKAAKQTESILSEKVQSRDVSKQSVQVEIEPKPTTAKAVKLTCNACGQWGHEMSKFNLKEHPDANRSLAKWAESVKGKECKARGYDFIPKQIKDKSTRIDSTPNIKGRASIKTK